MSKEHMTKKTQFSLSVKLTFIVVSIAAVIIFSLTYINLSEQASFFEKNYAEKSVTLAKSLDASITFYLQNQLNETEQLQQYIETVSEKNEEILNLSINVPTELGGLKTLVSNNENLINTSANTYNIIAYEKNVVVYIPRHIESSHTITVIVPLNVSGTIVGTYEIVLSMNQAYAAFDTEMRMLIIVSIISLFLLTFGSLYLLRRTIVKPIIQFRNAVYRTGGGNLNERITITSQDELGQLASAFNQMTTDLKNSQYQIEQYSKMLEGLLDQKDEFIKQLGHDLKNPLVPLVNLLPIIAEKEKDPTVKEHLKMIVKNAEYMRDLVIKTLQLARLRSPNTQFEFEHLNLNEFIVQVITNQGYFLKENNIQVKTTIPPNVTVKADRLQLIELFNNLITNAVKYTPKEQNGGTIAIEAQQQGTEVTISISDTGIGMTEEQLTKVFTEFFKVDKTRQELDSSGLGLSICQRIIEKHSGKIWVNSPGVGKGTTFFFTLPTGDHN
jgi:signal transduction histidine kinase